MKRFVYDGSLEGMIWHDTIWAHRDTRPGLGAASLRYRRKVNYFGAKYMLFGDKNKFKVGKKVSMPSLIESSSRRFVYERSVTSSWILPKMYLRLSNGQLKACLLYLNSIYSETTCLISLYFKCRKEIRKITIDTYTFCNKLCTKGKDLKILRLEGQVTLHLPPVMPAI